MEALARALAEVDGQVYAPTREREHRMKVYVLRGITYLQMKARWASEVPPEESEVDEVSPEEQALMGSHPRWSRRPDAAFIRPASHLEVMKHRHSQRRRILLDVFDVFHEWRDGFWSWEPGCDDANERKAKASEEIARRLRELGLERTSEEVQNDEAEWEELDEIEESL